MRAFPASGAGMRRCDEKSCFDADHCRCTGLRYWSEREIIGCRYTGAVWLRQWLRYLRKFRGSNQYDGKNKRCSCCK